MRFAYCLFALLMLLMMEPTTAQACSCIEVTTDARIENSIAIFEGRLVRMESDSGSRRLVFQVTRYWKGVSDEYVHVETPLLGSLCGYEGFRTSDYYLIFARRGDGDTLVTGLCDGNSLADEAADTLAELGAGVTPVRVRAGDAEEPGPPPITATPPAGRAGCQSCTAGAPGSPLSPGPLAVILTTMWLIASRRRRTRVAS